MVDVLIVDDAPMTRAMIGKMVRLVRPGSVIEFACNGAEAVQLVTQGLQPTVICMDLMMPVLGGQAAMQQIRALELARHAVPARIIACSASAQEFEFQALLGAGFDGVLLKPFTTFNMASLLFGALPC